MNERELIEKQAELGRRLFGILDAAEQEYREGKRPTADLSAEEKPNYDALHDDLVKIEEQMQALATSRERKRELAEREARLRESGPRDPIKNIPDTSVAPKTRRGTEEYDKAFRKWLAATGDEQRALSQNVDAEGGFTQASEQFIAELIRAVDDEVAVRRISRTFSVDRSASIGIPVLDSKLADATWGTELTVATADATLDFGKRRLTPNALTVRILVSKLLKLSSSIDIDGLVQSEFARAIGETEETAFMEGSGAGRPLGCFIADVNGISTTRDNATGSSSGSVTADNLIRTFYTLKPQYRRNATWVLNRGKLRDARILQDANRNYIWLPAGFGSAQGVVPGAPPTILDRPYIESEFAPNTTASTTGTGTASTGYNAIVGDFRAGYWIADGPGLGIQNYDQINAVTNQDTYIGLFQVDGAPVLEEAFARSRLST
jgi:HK97 family phage major capsid protein